MGGGNATMEMFRFLLCYYRYNNEEIFSHRFWSKGAQTFALNYLNVARRILILCPGLINRIR